MKLFKGKKPVVKKPVKKYTWSRNFRAFELRLDRQQQQRDIGPETVDETERTCPQLPVCVQGTGVPAVWAARHLVALHVAPGIFQFFGHLGTGQPPHVSHAA